MGSKPVRDGETVCIKGFRPLECPHNPKLGCDCGINPPLKWNDEKQRYE